MANLDAPTPARDTDGSAHAGEVDGRSARRARGRAAVIDAAYTLAAEGITEPTSDQIAERAGVSPSSVFRYFDGVEELRHQTVQHHFERFADAFEVPDIGEGPLDERIVRFVDARLALYEGIAPIGRLARSRAIRTTEAAEALAATQQRFADQVRRHFAPELELRTRAAADDLAMSLTAITSFEAWDLLTTSHGRTRRQLRRAWTTALGALLATPAR